MSSYLTSSFFSTYSPQQPSPTLPTFPSRLLASPHLHSPASTHPQHLSHAECMNSTFTRRISFFSRFFIFRPFFPALVKTCSPSIPFFSSFPRFFSFFLFPCFWVEKNSIHTICLFQTDFASLWEFEIERDELKDRKKVFDQWYWKDIQCERIDQTYTWVVF